MVASSGPSNTADTWREVKRSLDPFGSASSHGEGRLSLEMTEKA